MSFKVNIETGNSAFGGTYETNVSEIKRILKGVINSLESGKYKGSCIDLNGNCVGGFELVNEDYDEYSKISEGTSKVWFNEDDIVIRCCVDNHDIFEYSFDKEEANEIKTEYDDVGALFMALDEMAFCNCETVVSGDLDNENFNPYDWLSCWNEGPEPDFVLEYGEEYSEEFKMALRNFFNM
jgi:hypothetical protein